MAATNVARAGKRGNICVGNNVSSFARAFRGALYHIPNEMLPVMIGIFYGRPLRSHAADFY